MDTLNEIVEIRPNLNKKMINPFRQSMRKCTSAMQSASTPDLVMPKRENDEVNDVKYAIDNNTDDDDVATYRMVEISSDTDMDQLSSSRAIHTTPLANSIAQMIPTTFDGQLYLIPAAGDTLLSTTTSSGQRAIVPKQVMLTHNSAAHNKPANAKRRDDKRRATHNEVERRRRDKINNWIVKLSKIIPESTGESSAKTNGAIEGQSKGGILAKACEYIMELRQTNERLQERCNSLTKVQVEYNKVSGDMEKLVEENFMLRKKLEMYERKNKS